RRYDVDPELPVGRQQPPIGRYRHARPDTYQGQWLGSGVQCDPLKVGRRTATPGDPQLADPADELRLVRSRHRRDHHHQLGVTGILEQCRGGAVGWWAWRWCYLDHDRLLRSRIYRLPN